MAALSFRHYNRNLSIAVVTNNETVDRFTPRGGLLFTHVIRPRADLLFAGSGLQAVSGRSANARESMPKQWTTRILYMAFSPFEITWALDSNVYQCPNPLAHDAVHGFLLSAERTGMWGYDIAHANQHSRKGGGPLTKMYPHNFNIIYRWNERTSNMFRDWIMLQIRRGIGTDDQRTLLQAEYRQQRTTPMSKSSSEKVRHAASTAGTDSSDAHGRLGATLREYGHRANDDADETDEVDGGDGSGLRVGQVPTEFAAAFYSPWMDRTGDFLPRVTRTLTGPAQIVHATPMKRGFPGQNGPEWCMAFNAGRGKRRQLAQFSPAVGTPIGRCPIVTLRNFTTCKSVLAGPRGQKWPEDWSAEPMAEEGRDMPWSDTSSTGSASVFDGCPFSGGGMHHWRRPWEGEILPATLATP